jgi:hypothetical protein
MTTRVLKITSLIFVYRDTESDFSYCAETSVTGSNILRVIYKFDGKTEEIRKDIDRLGQCYDIRELTSTVL